MIVVILLAVLVIAMIVVVVLARRSDQKEEKKGKSSVAPSKTEKATPNPPKGERYINPTDFSVGVIKDAPCVPSDTCGSKVLYPLSNPDVDYGSKMPKGCPCDQFLESP